MSDCAFLRVRLNCCESENTFRWVHRECNFVFVFALCKWNLKQGWCLCLFHVNIRENSKYKIVCMISPLVTEVCAHVTRGAVCAHDPSLGQPAGLDLCRGLMASDYCLFDQVKYKLNRSICLLYGLQKGWYFCRRFDISSLRLQKGWYVFSVGCTMVANSSLLAPEALTLGVQIL